MPISHPTPDPRAAQCPLHAVPRGVAPGDELVLPLHQRVVAQYARDAAGATELRLFHGDKEISFDEPDLFAFGEQLAAQSRFVAASATGWGEGLDWARVQPLLTQLVDEGVLRHAAQASDEGMAEGAARGARPSPLPPATCQQARGWNECEAITTLLTGRALEPGWLELVIPVFRVAHLALDADGRQVGEANVFPPALRLDVPTNWRTCLYAGTRFQVDRPMNVSALKAMREHWPVMMAALRHIRAAWLRRCPAAAGGFTVGELERLSVAVLGVATWPLVRPTQPLASGELHPALSSLFRVTDGLRMTMHQMLFVPVGEPTRSPDAPVTSREIVDYAERNHSFHSSHGVCAGPRSMVEEFLAVLVDGRPADDGCTVPLPSAVQQAFDQLEPAIDYALRGLQAHAVVFSLWPQMARSYERLHAVADAWAGTGHPGVTALRDRLRGHCASVREASYLGHEAWRAERELVYADMYAQCGRALGDPADAPTLFELIAQQRLPRHADVEGRLGIVLRHRFGAADGADATHRDALQAALLDFLGQLQAILRAACSVQARLNRQLGRVPPVRRFSAADVDLHNQLQGAAPRRLPFLVAEIEALLRVRLVVDTAAIEVHEHPSDRPAHAGDHPDSSGMSPREQRAFRT